MFAGPNGSGKSSLYARLLAEGHFAPTTFLNADEVQSILDSGGKYSVPFHGAESFERALRRSPFLGRDLSEDDLSTLSGTPREGLFLSRGRRCAPYLAAAIVDALRIACVSEGTTFAFETVMSHESNPQARVRSLRCVPKRAAEDLDRPGFRTKKTSLLFLDPGSNQA